MAASREARPEPVAVQRGGEEQQQAGEEEGSDELPKLLQLQAHRRNRRSGIAPEPLCGSHCSHGIWIASGAEGGHRATRRHSRRSGEPAARKLCHCRLPQRSRERLLVKDTIATRIICGPHERTPRGIGLVGRDVGISSNNTDIVVVRMRKICALDW